jgi:predicted dehydrogenase
MIVHPALSLIFVGKEDGALLEAFFSFLKLIPGVQLTIKAHLPDEVDPYDVVVTLNSGDDVNIHDRLEQFVKAGGGWLELVHLSDSPLPHIFGVQPTPVGPRADLRVMFKDSDHPLAVRWPDAIYVSGKYQALEPAADDSYMLLYADWKYEHRAVLVTRNVGDGRVASTTVQAYDHPAFQQILYRLLRELAGQIPAPQTLGVGILGYSPHIGQNHGIAIAETAGLVFKAVCDANPERLNRAGTDFPAVQSYDSADAFAGDSDIDLVIICTPPNTHAHLSLEMMRAGKHVLCEKPLALRHRDAVAMMEMAEDRKLHLSCHQNRRCDVDYLAIKQAVADGLIGELFFVETFVGGFSHPCGYWHSHEEISGGTAYDWGAHYLDWIASLMPDRVEAVIGTRHKRVWHDVTNADQERIQIRFTGGQEAEFIHSDIAGAPKPKWYLLGTRGAIIGQWRNVTQYEIDPHVYFHEHAIPPTEMTPDLILHQRQRSGQMIMRRLDLPERQPYAFFGNLADHLFFGEPLLAPLKDSVLVVSILEAAARSAAHGGSVEALNV